MHDAAEQKGGWVPRAAVFGALWFVATFYFLGDLGKWMDDWIFHVRDPATGTFKWGYVFALDPLNSGFLAAAAHSFVDLSGHAVVVAR